MVISETISSLSYCAQHPKGRLYGCLAFLQAWLGEHLLVLASFPTYVSRDLALVQIHVRSRPLPNMTSVADYQSLLAAILPKQITWQAILA